MHACNCMCGYAYHTHGRLNPEWKSIWFLLPTIPTSVSEDYREYPVIACSPQCKVPSVNNFK